MGLARCERCEQAFHCVRWIDLTTGELASGFENAAQLCHGCQSRVRAEARPTVGARTDSMVGVPGQ